MSQSASEPLRQLQDETLGVLNRVLDRGSAVALLDFPRHQNAGDSLIWEGTLEYLRRLGIRVDYVASAHHLDAGLLRRRVPDGHILIHGGGNLGDRWREHQDFRERILREFPDRTIIQLPQTPEFSSADARLRIIRKFDAHADLTLLIREKKAAQELKEQCTTTKVFYCPDLALGYGYLDQVKEPEHAVLALFRKDNEAVGTENIEMSTSDVLISDWRLSGLFPDLKWWILRLPENVIRVAPWMGRALQPLLMWSFTELSKFNIRSASALLTKGRVVATDRLHAMVLGVLLRLPVVATDNANHKVVNIFEDYIHLFPGVSIANSRAEAIRIALALSQADVRDGR